MLIMINIHPRLDPVYPARSPVTAVKIERTAAAGL
jgi:hypothetical protein